MLKYTLVLIVVLFSGYFLGSVFTQAKINQIQYTQNQLDKLQLGVEQSIAEKGIVSKEMQALDKRVTLLEKKSICVDTKIQVLASVFIALSRQFLILEHLVSTNLGM